MVFSITVVSVYQPILTRFTRGQTTIPRHFPRKNYLVMTLFSLTGVRYVQVDTENNDILIILSIAVFNPEEPTTMVF